MNLTTPTRNRAYLVIHLDDGIHGRVELLGGLEEGELDDEEVLERLAAQLRDQLASGLRGPACTILSDSSPSS